MPIKKRFNYFNIVILFFSAFFLFSFLPTVIVANFFGEELSIKANITPALELAFGDIDFGEIFSGGIKERETVIKLGHLFISNEKVNSIIYEVKRVHSPRVSKKRDFCQRLSNFPDTKNWKNFSQEDWTNFLGSHYLENCDLSLCPFIEIKKSPSDNPNENKGLLKSRPKVKKENLGFFDVFSERESENPDPDEIIKDILKDDNDYGTQAFSYPKIKDDKFKYLRAKGSLNKKNNDLEDHWIIELNAPCFTSEITCNAKFKESFDKIPDELKDLNFACEIWFKVVEIK